MERFKLLSPPWTIEVVFFVSELCLLAQKIDILSILFMKKNYVWFTLVSNVSFFSFVNTFITSLDILENVTKFPLRPSNKSVRKFCSVCDQFSTGCYLSLPYPNFSYSFKEKRTVDPTIKKSEILNKICFLGHQLHEKWTAIKTSRNQMTDSRLRHHFQQRIIYKSSV